MVYARVTMLMPAVAMKLYLSIAISNVVAAKRQDRFPHYFRRSIVLSTMCLLPLYVLQAVSGNIMESIGVSEDIAKLITPYCTIMVAMNQIKTLNMPVEVIIVNLGYTKSLVWNSLLSGLLVQIFMSYYLISVKEMGVVGAALAEICAQSMRLLYWAVMTHYFDLWNCFFGSIGPDSLSLFDTGEMRLFVSLAVPRMLSFVATWICPNDLIILFLVNISGIPESLETATLIMLTVHHLENAALNGFTTAIRIRVLNLLGLSKTCSYPVDARRSFRFNVKLTVIANAFLNLVAFCLVIPTSRIISNDEDVRSWYQKLGWLYLFRCISTNSTAHVVDMFLTPLKYGHQEVAIGGLSYFLVGLPCTILATLTNVFTTSLQWKVLNMFLFSQVVPTTTRTIIFYAFMVYFLNWSASATTMRDRAMSDRRPSLALVEKIDSDVEEGTRGDEFEIATDSKAGSLCMSSALENPLPMKGDG